MKAALSIFLAMIIAGVAYFIADLFYGEATQMHDGIILLAGIAIGKLPV